MIAIAAVMPLLSVLMLATVCDPTSAEQPEPGPVCAEQAWAQVGGAPSLDLELALTPEQRARGLMFRETLAENAGMLFIFPRESNGGFWMRNTSVPLSIAYLGRDGQVLDIQDMQPFDERSHRPASRYWLALEVNQGWFAQHGVVVGDVFNFCYGSSDGQAS